MHKTGNENDEKRKEVMGIDTKIVYWVHVALQFIRGTCLVDHIYRPICRIEMCARTHGLTKFSVLHLLGKLSKI